MKVITSKGRVRSIPGRIDGISRALDAEGYFDQVFPRVPGPDHVKATCERLAGHSAEWRDLWFAQHPEDRAPFEAFEAATKR
jgi:hypothetical protein